MTRIEIRLLGPFEAAVDGEPITDFESDSARALLAFLASEPGRRRSRAALAEMLWPERPPGAALSNLRHVLSVLRRALGDGAKATSMLLADRANVAIDASPDLWVDLVEFERATAIRGDAEGALDAWQRADVLRRGPVLDGVRVRAGAEWDEWLVVTEERVRRRLAAVLGHLADHHEQAGEWELALPVVRRLIEVDPWAEKAHRQLMRLLALSGEPTHALAHYGELCERLDAEFATSPTADTVLLASRLEAGEFPVRLAESDIVYPEFLTSGRAAAAPPSFAGRHRELSALRAHLDAALAGRGRAVFVAGEAGSGKTMLAHEFLHRAAEVPGLVGTRGRCNAFGGLGDPYLPFREALALLTGDVEAAFSVGEIDREQATRLWETIPLSIRLICDRGPSLIGVMVNGARFVARAGAAAPDPGTIDELRTLVERAARRPPSPERMQPALFDEFTSTLTGIAAVRPVVIVIDDLQWADRGSISLLWHIARRLDGHPVLLIGLYRPEEVPTQGESIHPLAEVLGELKAALPEGTIELGADRGFIDAFLDTEPNELGDDFRERLFAYTQGHPLFTVEMVRGMQERAELRRNRAGVWTAPGSLDWYRLPERVGAVIGQRIARLPDELRDDLTVAAIQGEEFVAEAVAMVRSDPQVPDRLSFEAGALQRLIEPAATNRINETLVTRHRFRHVLFQAYLYDRLNQAKRVRLHEATGHALEDLYRGSPDVPVVELAYQFDEAGLVAPAVEYLHLAGQRAYRMAANEEAIRLLERAHTLLGTLPESPERDNHELALLVALAAAVMAARGYASEQAGSIGYRVRELCDRVELSPLVGMALIGLAQVLAIRAQYRECAAVSREALDVAEKLDDSALRVFSNLELGYALMWMGDLVPARTYLERGCDLHDPDLHSWLKDVFGAEPGPEVMAWAGFDHWLLGYPDRAMFRVDEGIALARRLEHPFTLCHALAGGGSTVRRLRGEYREALAHAEELAAISEAEHFPFWHACSEVQRGAAIGCLGDPDAGIELIDRGLERWRGMGVAAFQAWFQGDRARLEHLRGQTSRGLEIVDAAQAEAEAAGERISYVHLAVQKGTLLRETKAPGALDAIEATIKEAQSIGSLSLELEATTQLALHLEERDMGDAGRAALAAVYGRFTEGFRTRDLVAARRVLDWI